MLNNKRLFFSKSAYGYVCQVDHVDMLLNDTTKLLYANLYRKKSALMMLQQNLYELFYNLLTKFS